jgi:prepilin-type N-terminal cleavage/methylation domain-containing protein
MRERLRQLHAEQSGFTLPELLTSIVIGMIVIMAAFMLLDRAVTGSAQIADRADASQRGRVAMEEITQRLRSEVCLGDAQPIVSAADDAITFYTNLSSNPNAAQKRTLRYVASEKRLYEDIYTGTGTFPALTFPSSPNTTRELVRPIVQATKKVGTTTVTLPFFRYYKYTPNTTTGALTQLTTTPLSADDAADVVMVAVAFRALPIRKVERTSDDAAFGSTFEGQAYVRLADPSNPSEGPSCL